MEKTPRYEHCLQLKGFIDKELKVFLKDFKEMEESFKDFTMEELEFSSENVALQVLYTQLGEIAIKTGKMMDSIQWLKRIKEKGGK